MATDPEAGVRRAEDELREQVRVLRAALEAQAYERDGQPCWCCGVWTRPGTHAQKCEQARAALTATEE